MHRRLFYFLGCCLLVGLVGWGGVGPAGVPEVEADVPAVVYLPIILRDYAPPHFSMQNGHPAYIQNWANPAGCAWLGIAGQAFNLAGQPLDGYYVQLEGGGLNYVSITGSQPAYGLGGYELYIADHVIESTGVYTVQLRDAAGTALSPRYSIDTYADCTKNLIVVNFVQNP